ncbi:hypothetical protein AQUCO_06400023v1 [Aquilegia coerulea]|uniref:Uncharacterized protein n=1 Tax=Aquilegia coerulea TaxID=218851 RepID=A0A2G5CCH8_AQUCA|nr:hypothetical protein AQUCO_06400023v1 [Aquilegia coerulea]
MASQNNTKLQTISKHTCLCAPTTHPGSFRCRLHRSLCKVASSNKGNGWGSKIYIKANSLKDILMQIIKPSKHDLKRRRNFQPKLTRFSLMNNTNNANSVIALR